MNQQRTMKQMYKQYYKKGNRIKNIRKYYNCEKTQNIGH